MKQILYISLLFISLTANATVYTTAASGSWTSGSTWVGGSAPAVTPVDTVIINHTVNYGNNTVTVYEYLEVGASGKLWTDRNKAVQIHQFSTLVNYGEVDIPNLVVDGTVHNYNVFFTASFTNRGSGRIYNHTGAEFNSSGQVSNSGIIINDGLLNSPHIFVNNNGTLTGDGGTYLFDANVVSNAGATIMCSGPLGIDICSSDGSEPSSVIYSSGYIDSSCVTICGRSLDGGSGLPITLISFEAEEGDNGSVDLTWATANEINNEYFEIQRSENGIDFETVEIVPGAGNSTIRLDYSTTDVPPMNTVVYYRLKQTDYDGKTTTSDLVVVKVSQFEFGFDVAPNPTKGQFTIHMDNATADELNVTIYNTLGQIVKIDVAQTEPGLPVNLNISLNNELPSGSYFVNLTSGTDNMIKQLILE